MMKQFSHAFLLLILLGCFEATFAQDTRRSVGKERQKQGNRLAGEAGNFRSQGKLVEAIDATEKMLAIERELSGTLNSDLAADWLAWLAELYDECEDFAKARKARE